MASSAVQEAVAFDSDADQNRGEELCRRLSGIKVSRIMSSSTINVPPHFSVKEAMTVLRRHRACAAPVVDGTGRILGLVTLAEIDRLIGVLTGSGPPGSIRAENITP